MWHSRYGLVNMPICFFVCLSSVGISCNKTYNLQILNLRHLFNTINLFLPVQEMMPLQHIYTMALEQDIKNSMTSRRTYELLQSRCYQV